MELHVWIEGSPPPGLVRLEFNNMETSIRGHFIFGATCGWATGKSCFVIMQSESPASSFIPDPNVRVYAPSES
ncbi:hypothetical protein FOPE_12724 [Fonsecaea pedrosoi]|nr:hypothetical protein FOPE_12724 [Fonsecaea pedrosoi]